MDKIKVMVVDDHALFREGLRRIVDHEEDMDCVATTGNGEDAVKLAQALNPDVLLIDVEMPGMDGFDAASQIKASCRSAAVIMLSAYKHRNYVFRAIREGVDGYLTKDVNPHDLLDSIRKVRGGNTVFSLDITEGSIQQPATAIEQRDTIRCPLNASELEVLRLVAAGVTNREIARAFNLSSHAVRTQIHNIFSKLGVKSRTEAVIFALKVGLITTDSSYLIGRRKNKP